MSRKYWQYIHVEKTLGNPLKGCSWVEMLVDDIKRFNVPKNTPVSYTKLTFEQRQAAKTPSLPSRVIPIVAICSWLKTWAAPDTQLVTPSGKTHQLNGAKVGNQAHFIYFIFNADSVAISIGRAKNVSKRLQALQTSSPAVLTLLKNIPIEGLVASQSLEMSLHQQFKELRLDGEWFRADTVLTQYIEDL